MKKMNNGKHLLVGEPCHEDWNQMTGNDQVRFCSHCAQSVNNISEMTRREAMRLIRKSDGRVCVRYESGSIGGPPIFAQKLHQISRRSRIAAGIIGASLTLTAVSYSQVLRPGRDQVETVSKNDRTNRAGGKGILAGIVTDESGGAIPNATVTLVNSKTGRSAAYTANAEGVYEISGLEPGDYRLEASANMFKAKTAEFTLSTDRMTLNVELPASVELVTMGMVAITEFKNPLFRAVSKNDVATVKRLIGEGANVNETDKNGNRGTPLFLAVENGSTEIVRLLLEMGAEVNARDDAQQTPLMSLDEDSSVELVELLFKYGADADLVGEEKETALIAVAGDVDKKVLKVLIRNTNDINAKNADGRTALMEAAFAENLENVRALLLAGADPRLRDNDGETAIDFAASDEIVALLVTFGADADQD